MKKCFSSLQKNDEHKELIFYWYFNILYKYVYTHFYLLGNQQFVRAKETALPHNTQFRERDFGTEEGDQRERRDNRR